jgi:hypothetical protein
VRYGVSNNNAECHHSPKCTVPFGSVLYCEIDFNAAHLQCPLRHRNGNQSRLAEAVLDSTLKRVCPTKLGVDYDELNGPIDGDCEGYQKEYTGEETCLEKSVRLADDASSSIEC